MKIDLIERLGGGFNQNHISKCLEYQDVIANQQSKIEHLTEMNKRYLGKMQEQQDQIAELNEQLQAMRNAWEFVEGCRKEWHESYMRVREQIDQRISNGASITQHRIDL